MKTKTERLLEDKIIIVTGASTGIGKEIAKLFAVEGAYVLLAARRRKKLEKVKQEIGQKGGRASVCVVDLSIKNDVSRFIDSVKEKYNHINSIVNVAGIWHDDKKAFYDINFDEYEQKIILDTYNVGLVAPTLLAHGLIPIMPKGSTIINISGTFENGAKGWLPYYVSKKGIEALTIGLADELRDRDINVNCISPSDTATEEYKKYFPQYIDESVSPLEIARYALRLASREMDQTGKIDIIKK